ncbi:MAG: NifB/NifX family molybdenum-iron cluster-binding protein [Deltaproteobacteria bacterium]|nr:NifB/NifX family molybdenum-iron cluster-binding protein [Deltaproteobacteria bacterium]
MNICIPVEQDNGLDSAVCAHFGSAPFFLMVDTDTQACRAIPNRNQHHAHGMCQPLAALAGEHPDAIVVGGIGRGALMRLVEGGLRVYRAAPGTARQLTEALIAGRLAPMSELETCGGHGHAHQHGHGQMSS